MAYRYESQTIARVVLGLVSLGLCSVGLIGWLAWNKVPIPESLTAVAVGSMTALATLLTTFTPSPVPGGRRAIDAAAAPMPPAATGSTSPVEGSNFGGIDIVTGKGTAHG